MWLKQHNDEENMDINVNSQTVLHASHNKNNMKQESLRSSANKGAHSILKTEMA